MIAGKPSLVCWLSEVGIALKQCLQDVKDISATAADYLAGRWE